MDADAELGRNPVASTKLSLGMEMSRLKRDGIAEPVSRDQILRREWGQGNIHFPCSADHEQDWQPYSVDFLTVWVMTTGQHLQLVVCVCFLPIHSGHQVRWTYQPGSHRRKVTQDF